MKKLLFSAAIALVAVGGALTANADIAWVPGNPSTQITCDEGDVSCSDAFSGITLYQTNPDLGSALEVDPSTYEKGFQN